jgi:replicative DNA helicase
MPNELSEIVYARNFAEQSLLGSILLDSASGSREVILKVSTIVTPDDFYDDLHKRIYRAMLACANPPHQINVAYEMARLNNLMKGDCAYLLNLIATTPNWLDYLDYADKVKAYSLQRQGIKRPMIRGAYDR